MIKFNLDLVNDLFKKMNPIHIKFNIGVGEAEKALIEGIIGGKSRDYIDLCSYVRYNLGDKFINQYIINRYSREFRFLPMRLEEEAELKYSISMVVDSEMRLNRTVEESIKEIKKALLTMYNRKAQVADPEVVVNLGNDVATALNYQLGNAAHTIVERMITQPEQPVLC